ncbi:biotin--[acetyl-CoA-carboxylase] ligase [Pontimonas sp.]|uniref:biotin--[acetyl-CoA-carboxylase] ligase n=1 Tax=Pontimonas sp. TaxID=2304492 RepID=UPI00286FBDC1|nr:biotin--[acetyl-CoA-carboxylase] ligase [Pontimonas sp.]MDR9396721.1 biotin--[acetyl-CoA-carboxylase] ligase [Pontimonas sp.]
MWPEHPAPCDLTGLADEVVWLESTESTNSHTARLPASAGSRVVASWNQTAGVGRMGRTWVSPPGRSLALSVELGPQLTPADLSADVSAGVSAGLSSQWRGLLPLLVGTQLAHALGGVVPGVGVKWPNDVQIGGDKVAGILGEIVPPGRVIVGVGINVALTRDQLPTESATSLLLHGLDDRGSAAEEAFAGALREFLAGLTGSLAQARDGIPASLWSMVRGALSTIGKRVRVSFPDGHDITGVAEDLDSQGRLIVRTETGGTEVIAAADIEHLRPA